ncbi:MAG: trigger factor [Bdellovibrionota bacterium]
MSLEGQKSERKFNCTITDVNSVVKLLDISVSKEDFSKKYQNLLNYAARNMKIKGFRQGKAPKDMVEAIYKEAMMVDAKEKLLNEAIDSCIKESDLKVISVTNVDITSDTKEDGFSFTATVELFPTPPKVPEYVGIEIEVQKDEYSEERLDKAMQDLISRYSTLKAVEDRDTPTKDDTVKFTLSYKYEDGSLEEEKEHVRGLSESIWNSKIDGSSDSAVRELLLTMKKGETKECPSLIEISNKKGKFDAGKVVYVVKLKEIFQKKEPELTKNFLESNFSLSSVSELRDKVKESLQDEILRANKEREKIAIKKKLLESYDFEIPQTMLDREIEDIISHRFGIYEKSVSMKELAEDIRTTLRDSYNGLAKERVQTAFLLDDIIKIENIEASEEEYSDYLSNISRKVGVSLAKMRQDMMSNNLKPSIMLELSRIKALDTICDKVKFSYVALKNTMEDSVEDRVEDGKENNNKENNNKENNKKEDNKNASDD